MVYSDVYRIMRIRGRLGGVWVGDDYPVRVMGVINVSPESFYKGSVREGYEDVAEEARRMESLGADIIDVGAMSTAPYLETRISEEEEARRLREALEAVKSASSLPVSVDTQRLKPAKVAVEMGVEIINDVSGLREPGLARLAAEHGLSMVVCASGLGRLGSPGEGVEATLRSLRNAVERALKEGLDEEEIVIDPAIGFHRDTGVEWWKLDIELLRGIPRLRALGRPILIGVSRKSFLGKITGRKRPEDRLPATIASEALAAYLGAHVIRAHDVAEALDAVRVAEALKGGGSSLRGG